jgi:tRNA G10  N-methylase Trm11
MFTRPGEIVLDPFMGGGTTLVEACSFGRKAVGTDISSLATFTAKVKTTPLSENDFKKISDWLAKRSISTVND